MIQFILKVILSIFTVILDIVVKDVCVIISLLLWEKRWVDVPEFIFTKMIWNKDMNVTETK